MSDVDDALDRLAGDLRSHADVYTYLDRDKDAATVREELQRHAEEIQAIVSALPGYPQGMTPFEYATATAERVDVLEAQAEQLREERDAAEKYRQGEKRRREAAEAEVQRLTEGLRGIASLAEPTRIGWAEGLPRVYRISEKARALLSANPPPTLPCGHPESSVVSADEGTAYCGECASPPDGGGAK